MEQVKSFCRRYRRLLLAAAYLAIFAVGVLYLRVTVNIPPEGDDKLTLNLWLYDFQRMPFWQYALQDLQGRLRYFTLQEVRFFPFHYPNAVDLLFYTSLTHYRFYIIAWTGAAAFAVSRVAATLDASKHMIAVTSETSPLAKSDDYLAAFFMDDYIGGRYSSTSAVGGAVLSLAFGPDVFAQFLDGAAAEDKLSAEKDVLKNPEMLDALIGVYERNVLGYPSTAVLPYSQALNRFPAHLQQVDMESNGKSVNRFGEPVNYPTGPVIFGEPGTNGQHSFYQLLHQGTDIVPLQFVGFKNNQLDTDVVIQDSTSQQKLCANVAAQIVAFACGKEDENRNKNFEGGRPSSIIIGEQVNPKTLGALLAHFENKIMFQGFLWNVNSFDQEGVQLGKVLAKRVLAHETDGALKVFSDLLNI